MRNFILIFAAFFFLSFTQTLAQTASIDVKGRVSDSATLGEMLYTSITAIQASDSQLVSFTRADEEGKFSLSVPKPGKYIFIISHPVYANFITTQEVPASGLDLEDIELISKMMLIEEVIITEKRAITIKGDTTEYAADSFKVREFANVEELLKKLPGLEVDDKGNITAHGEKVQKMLVDGDEFFSDDPAVLSKMLRASAVDKVQVFDGKSEEAQFTGVDDGERIKTINLTLKDNAKAGYFGKVEAGGGLPGFWENQFMLNSFKDKRKISVFGVMSNTNKIGLGWEDMSKMTGNNGFEMMGDEDGEGGGFGMNIRTYSSSAEDEGFSDFGGSFGGQGLPKTWNAGLHFGDKFGKEDQHDVSADYRLNKNDLSTIVNSRNQYILPDTQYYNNTKSDRFSSSLVHSLSTKTTIKVDSTADLIIRASGSLRNNKSESRNYSDYTDLDNNKINESNSIRESNTDRKNINTTITFRKKLKKKGRTFTGSFNGSYNNSLGESDFYSENIFATPGSDRIYNQRKTDSTNASNLNLRVTYTEPLAEKIFLTTNAYTRLSNSNSANFTYDKDGGDEILNDTFSSNYGFRVWTNSAGANLRFNYEKIKFSFGGNIAFADFVQTNRFTGQEYSYNFTNFFPRASVSFGKNRTSNLELRYDGSTNQPSIDQIQPIIVNNDPLNIRLGNPDLKQEFRHNLSINFGRFKILTERYLYGNIGISTTDNAISTEQSISPLGIRTYRSINLDGNFSAYGFAGYSFKFKPLKTRVSVNANGNFFRNNALMNGIRTTTDNTTFGVNLRLDYNKDTTLNFSYDVGPSFNTSSASTGANVKTDFFSIRQNLNLSYLFKYGIEIGTDVDWYVREKTDEFDRNNNIFQWNAYASKSFLKDRSLVVRFTGNDILNQNIGFNRYVSNNSVYETTYNNIKRYFMLSIAWNFTKSSAMGSSSSSVTEEKTEVKEADTDPDNYKE